MSALIIDFHTHAFPDKIAVKAIETLRKNAGFLMPYHDGTVSSLSEYIKKSGADKAVLLNIATNPRQQHSVNNFAIEQNKDDVISFGSVHPDSPDVFEELQRLKDAGIKGIKLHPDYQLFFTDDKKMVPIYERIAELGFITIFHAGVDVGYFDPVHNTPERMAKALEHFGDAPVVAAHWGGYMQWNDVEKYLVGKNIYLDTAFSYGRMPKDHAKRIISAHGAERILFGSDMPWSGTDNEMRFIDSLDLTDDEKEKVLGGNAKRLLKL